MFYIKKLIQTLGVFLISTMILVFLITLFYYFDVFSNNIYNIFKFIIPSLTLLISTILFGKQAEKKGWLEGIKIGGVVILLFLTLSSLVNGSDFSLRMMIYYIILLLISAVGGMIGINRKKD